MKLTVMMVGCRECGCQCRLCTTNSLDLHHEIESLVAQLAEAKMTVTQLKAEASERKQQISAKEQRCQDELTKLKEKHDWLQDSHRRMEDINHNLEDKILLLVQDNDREKEATMAIHMELQNQIKAATSRLEQTVQEKDDLASNCQAAIDLLRRYVSENTSASDHVYMSKEISRINRSLEKHNSFRISESSEEITPKVVPISTFPPCVVMFNHSPKLDRRRTNQMPRNFSDSRLAGSKAHATNLQLCSRCKDVFWTRDFSTQTDSLLNHRQALSGTLQLRSQNRIIDI